MLWVFTRSAGGFVDVLKERCRMDWSVAALARVDYRAYFIFDEAQTLYSSNCSGDGDGRSPEWAHDSHVRMFALNRQVAMDVLAIVIVLNQT
jgi:hypothetical protein